MYIQKENKTPKNYEKIYAVSLFIFHVSASEEITKLS